MMMMRCMVMEALGAHIANSPYSIGTREVHSEEPRLISTSVPVRHTSSIGTFSK